MVSQVNFRIGRAWEFGLLLWNDYSRHYKSGRSERGDYFLLMPLPYAHSLELRLVKRWTQQEIDAARQRAKQMRELFE